MRYWRILWFFIGVFIVLWLVAGPLHAGDIDNQNYSHNLNENKFNDTSKAFGFGAGDVDIAQCYRSWSVILYQDTKVNPLCLAQQLAAEGKYEQAAILRCQPKSIHRAFGGKAACIAALREAPPRPPEPEPPVEDDDDEDVHAELEQELAQLAMQFQEQTRQLEHRPPQVIERIEQKPLLSKDQADSLRIVK